MAEAKTEGDSDMPKTEREKPVTSIGRAIEEESLETHNSKTYRKWIAVSLVTLLAAIILAQGYRKTSGFPERGMPNRTMREMDEKVVSMFVDFDTNMDGAIDLSEFLPIANRILERKGTPLRQEAEPEEPWDFSGETITIKSYFTPLVLSTMSKYNAPSSLGFDYPMEGLKSWKRAALPEATFPANAFSIFLPHAGDERLVGEPWYLVHPITMTYGPGLSNNRYVPPVAQGRVAILYRLLAMFHPRPFLMTRFGPQGTIACVRAQNKDYVDVVFRMHAEFQLNVAPLLPFWFTPGQFLGNIVIKRDGSHVKSFKLSVPNNKSLNVDMEWLVGQKSEPQADINDYKEDEHIDGGNEVDIGFMPRMELQSLGPSWRPHTNDPETDTLSSGDKQIDGSDDIHWDSEISLEEAHKALEIKMYPFKKVPYLSFQDAFARAKAENKLVHHILLWGVLDDQSC